MSNTQDWIASYHFSPLCLWDFWDPFRSLTLSKNFHSVSRKFSTSFHLDWLQIQTLNLPSELCLARNQPLQEVLSQCPPTMQFPSFLWTASDRMMMAVLEI